MELFDTHFHWDGKTPPYEIIREAADKGVKYLACVGGNYDSSVESRLFAESVDNCWFTAGVHPHYANNFDGNISQFEDLIANKKNVAIGEIGLDYYYEHSDKKKQMDVMLQFIQLGLKKKLPLVIHCRDKDGEYQTYRECYNALCDSRPESGSFVLHCYTGNTEWLEKFLALGAYIGITGIVTFPKADNVRDVLKLIPEDRLLIETDSPYLAPKPYRGKVNFPKFLPILAEKIAELKHIDIEQLAMTTTANARKFYRI